MNRKFWSRDNGFPGPKKSLLHSFIFMRSLENKKKYVCKVCSKDFDNYSNLLQHERCHKRYGTTGYCLICGKRLNTAKKKICSLKCVGIYNSSTRVKKEGWNCTYCNKNFRTKKELYSHIKSTHSLSEIQKIKASRKSPEERSNIAKKGVETKRRLNKLKHTETTKIKLSLIASSSNHKSNNFKHVPYIVYTRKNGEKVKLRGSYEVRFAKYLDNNNFDWIYGKIIRYSDVAHGKTFRYLKPDFYIPKLNKFFDTKGYLSEESKYKYKLVFEQLGITIHLVYLCDIEKLENGTKSLLDF